MAEIDFAEYLSEDERKEIVKGVFHAKCVQAFEKDAERIFSNAAHAVVYKTIDDMHNGEVAKIISDKATEVIKDMSEYSIFRPQDPWGNKQSLAYKVLQDCVVERKSLIADRLEKVINDIHPKELSDLVKEEAAWLIDTKLFGRKSA